jgi:ribonucleoside-diphosphate reductase alpha chain
VDYIFRWMASHFLPVEDQDEVGVVRREGSSSPALIPDPKPVSDEYKIIAASAPKTGGSVQRLTFLNTGDAPACADCGAITVRSGSCYKCMNCGATTGCS